MGILKNLIYLLLLCVYFFQAAEIYDHKKSYVTYLGKQNWENQVNKIRQTTKQISLVQFYKSNDYDSRDFAQHYDQMAKEYKGILRIGAVDCVQEAQLCEKEKVGKWPTFRVYPPFPQPAQDYEGPLESKKMSNWASRFIQSNVLEVNQQNVDTFINDSPSVPKAILFTDKPNGVPLIFKALSVAFEKKLFFGIIRSSDEQLVKQYNVKKFPQILVVKATERKPVVYNGEINYQSIFDFINIYSETFVSGGGSSQDSAASKLWLTELLPELHEKSLGDICVNLEGFLCAILFSEQKPEGALKETLIELAKRYSKKVQRGSNFKFMWIDSLKEKVWANNFNVESYPTLIILNPGRRKRYVLHDNNIDLNSILSTIEKINSGDARFLPVKTGDLPTLSSRDWK